MKYLTFAYPQAPRELRPGIFQAGRVFDLNGLSAWNEIRHAIPDEGEYGSLFELINAGPEAWQHARSLLAAAEGIATGTLGPSGLPLASALEDVLLFPPLPRPLTLRDFYAFEAHVATAHANRGKKVPPEWYRFPVFYFSNPNAVFGHGEPVIYPSASRAVDYELEVACVIGRPGVNIPASEAQVYIFGYLILNDWSARDLQMEEMRVGLGPAKGKDFASSLGPWIVTPDELVDRATGRPGVYDLNMVARVNGVERSRGNWKDIYYSFGEIIARASQDTFLLPGDVLGSGTVGTGCLLELTAGQGPWLQPGDEVELEIERLGSLRNTLQEVPEHG